MDCPTCGSEALIGATRCTGCGGSLYRSTRTQTLPPPVDAQPQATSDGDAVAGDGPSAKAKIESGVHALPAAPALAAHEPEARSLCSLCLTPCDVVAGAKPICPGCRNAAEAAQHAGASAQTVKRRTTRATTRRRGSLARTLSWLLVLGGAGAGAVFLLPRLQLGGDAGAELVAGARATSAVVNAEFPADGITQFRTTYDLRILRERSSGAIRLKSPPVFDVRQVATVASEIALVERGELALGLDVRAACTLESERGVVDLRDGQKRTVFPWDRHIGVMRVVSRPKGTPEAAEGQLVVGRDVPPLLTFGTTWAPKPELAAGAEWEGDVTLPCLPTADGAVAPSGFRCTFSYAGRKIARGADCVVVRVVGEPGPVQGAEFASFTQPGGSVRGTLLYDTRSGLLVQAELAVDTTVRDEEQHATETVHMTGRVTIDRK